MADTSPLPGAGTDTGEDERLELMDVHGEKVAVRRQTGPGFPDDEAMVRRKLQEQRTVVTASGEYHIDEAGDLVFAPFSDPDLGPRET